MGVIISPCSRSGNQQTCKGPNESVTCVWPVQAGEGVGDLPISALLLPLLKGVTLAVGST